ncbi:Co2+/Mg2+ efflux protein ApaG [Christiangramia aquimixticola]|uniref:Co2+/Mg2+ efflux protein ApaG n=1 Tax=Christiangramia aquimixticola TaxID=1697558 RepID=UPI003AA7D166
MIQKITKGIRISVETTFEGMLYKNYKLKYAFGYQISIENQSNTPVQLKSRFWEIRDALNETQIVAGEGVIGKQPVINPGESHTYNSGCLLTGPFGSMRGFYSMIDLNTGNPFKVNIPTFKLSATYALN